MLLDSISLPVAEIASQGYSAATTAANLYGVKLSATGRRIIALEEHDRQEAGQWVRVFFLV
jgi:hypothetical protein